MNEREIKLSERERERGGKREREKEGVRKEDSRKEMCKDICEQRRFRHLPRKQEEDPTSDVPPLKLHPSLPPPPLE